MDIMEDERTGGIERQDRRQTATAELGQAPSTGLSVNLRRQLMVLVGGEDGRRTGLTEMKPQQT